MEVHIIILGNWKYYVSEQYRPYFMSTTKSEPVKSITGKYLFFHPDAKILANIATKEIKNNGFHVAKINRKILGSGKDHVLCLYYHDDSRKYELAKKYQDKNGIHYRYWKSDEDTRKGKYSTQFLEQIGKKKSINEIT